MPSTNGTSKIHLSLPSRPDYLFTLYGFFNSLGAVCQFDEEANSAVVTAVIEAATNALQHGNHMDETKRIDIVVEVHETALLVTVTDMGQGVDPAIRSDRQLPEDIFALRGRGIALMRALMDRVTFDWTSSGTTVHLTKNRPATTA